MSGTTSGGSKEIEIISRGECVIVLTMLLCFHSLTFSSPLALLLLLLFFASSKTKIIGALRDEFCGEYFFQRAVFNLRIF